MSSVKQLQLQVAGGYIEFSLNILYFFEYLITFSQEVNVIWGRPWTLTTWLYALTRYSSLLFSIWTFVPITNTDCRVGQYMIDALELLQYLCYASFGALRVYAILNGILVVSIVVFLLNFVSFGTNLYVFAKSVVVFEDNICTSVFALPSYIILKRTYSLYVKRRLSDSNTRTVSLATRISVIVGDVLITAVTWIKTARLYRDARRLKTKAPLAEMLLYDGTMYFITLLILNVFKMIEQNTPVLVALSVSSSLISVMTPIIICRFILNLRQVKTTDSSSVSGNQLTKLRFVGNIGQSLEGSASADVEDEDLDPVRSSVLDQCERSIPQAVEHSNV